MHGALDEIDPARKENNGAHVGCKEAVDSFSLVSSAVVQDTVVGCNYRGSACILRL
jgi:hypothetical protein